MLKGNDNKKWNKPHKIENEKKGNSSIELISLQQGIL